MTEQQQHAHDANIHVEMPHTDDHCVLYTGGILLLRHQYAKVCKYFQNSVQLERTF